MDDSVELLLTGAVVVVGGVLRDWPLPTADVEDGCCCDDEEVAALGGCIRRLSSCW